MDYNYKKYEILTSKNINETKIVTISDLNFDNTITRSDLNDLIVKINDILPKYIFILGNICTYNNLENLTFKENLTYFFNLLSCIGKPFIVFGNRDYKLNEETSNLYININDLLDYYNNIIQYNVNNNVTSDDNFNIVGFNKNHLSYSNIDEARKEILNLLDRINNIIDKDKYNILITHYELEHLKLEKELLEAFDLILTGTNHKTIKKSLLKLNNQDNDQTFLDNNTFIKTGGVCKGEIGFIKIKRL